MVTIQVKNLIDFVAEVFGHAESSPEEAKRIATYLTTANLTGHDSHGVIRVPVYIRWLKTGFVVPSRNRRRHAFAGGRRWQIRLRPDRDAAGGPDRHREM
jgi:LDH2 family malate/lactate/ureidoglycolate dehydrogenase